MKNLTIKLQLNIVSLVVALSSLSMIGLIWYSINRVNELNTAIVHVNEVEIGMLSLRRHEKDFLARLNVEYVDKFKQQSENTKALIDTLRHIMSAIGHEDDAEKLEALSTILHNYANNFNQLVQVQNDIGLDHKSGLYGSLRNAVHTVEKRINELNDNQLLSQMLMLRRREKDFMLRRDFKYVEKLEKDYVIMSNLVGASNFSEADKAELSVMLQKYHDDFLALVQGYKVKGLNSKQGILGEMRNTVHQTEDLLHEIHQGVEREIRADISAYQWFSALLVTLLASVVVLGILVINRRIIGNANNLSRVMNLACKNHDLSLRSDIRGSDEISSTANVFNIMMTEFENLISNVKAGSDRLRKSTENLSVISQQTLSGVMRQRSESDMVATAMNEMSATVNEVARSASEAATASQIADKEAADGKNVVVLNTTGIRELAAEVERSSQAIVELNTESENIGTVLNVIREIAEQTNLLALNAAIEAARAGEQGRGFAVVADEVRTLASRSQQSTQEIQQIVERLQTKASAAVVAMESGRNVAQESVKHANSVSDSLDVILREISNINQMNMQIASAAEEQSTAAEEINTNISAISHVANETAHGAEQTTDTTRQLNALAQDLYTMVEQFKVRNSA